MSNKNVKFTFNEKAFDKAISKSLDKVIEDFNECPECKGKLENKEGKKYCSSCNNFINFVKSEKYNY